MLVALNHNDLRGAGMFLAVAYSQGLLTASQARELAVDFVALLDDERRTATFVRGLRNGLRVYAPDGVVTESIIPVR